MSLNLSGPTRDNPVLDPPAVLHLDNRWVCVFSPDKICYLLSRFVTGDKWANERKKKERERERNKERKREREKIPIVCSQIHQSNLRDVNLKKALRESGYTSRVCGICRYRSTGHQLKGNQNVNAYVQNHISTMIPHFCYLFLCYFTS